LPSQLPDDGRVLNTPAANPNTTPGAAKPDQAAAVTPPPVSTAADAPVGPRGPLGQPTGMPVPMGPGTTLPDALAGRDPTQFIAAEQLRGAGGESITAALLGLNSRPTMAGAMTAPPGNIEFFRHLTVAGRRAMVRRLLRKQHAEMRRLILLVERGPRRDRDGESGDYADEYLAGGTSTDGTTIRSSAGEGPNVGDLHGEEAAIERISGGARDLPFEDKRREGPRYQRERERLATTVRMLYLLEELLAMQDYAFSRMGTFAKG
jgi:hypothetical protein